MEIQELLARQRQAVVECDRERAVTLAREGLRLGADPARCIEEGFVAGIREVGRLWEAGEYFLPELVQGADAMKAAMAVLRPALLADAVTPDRGQKVVLGTVQGDVHDIGKTLVATVLEANGFAVVDLGKDVADERFLEAVRREQPAVLGLSALLTTTMVVQERVIERLEREGLRARVAVLVGGAPVTRAFAERIGADAYAADSMQALDQARRLVERRA